MQQDILTDSDVQTQPKPGWKEKFVAWLLLIVGILYVAAQVLNYLSTKSTFASSEDGRIVINRGELLSNVNTYVFIIFSLLAGILLLMGKKLGWIMGLAFLIFFTVVAGASVVMMGMLAVFGFNFIILLIFFMIVLTAVIFLLLPSARKKYRVGKHAWLATLVFLLALCSLIFFLK